MHNIDTLDLANMLVSIKLAIAFEAEPKIKINHVSRFFGVKLADFIKFHAHINDIRFTSELVIGFDQLAGMQSVKVTPANSPFKVDKASQVSEGALWTWFEARLSEWHTLTQSVATDDSTDTLTIPVLDNVKVPLTLVAGKRSLSVQCSGGTAPYKVLVKRRRKILESLKTEKTAIETKAINFKRGKSYRVVVEDAQGQHFWSGFKAVSKAPPYPEELQNVPDDIRPVLQATWLIFEANGKWIFEAYQQLGTSQPAQQLKTALAQGKEIIAFEYQGLGGGSDIGGSPFPFSVTIL
jgi:hypothetical protein